MPAMKPIKPNHDEGMWKGAPGESFEKARELRNRSTPSERLLWESLRNKQLDGYKFRRQHPVSIFIVDFYCHELKFVIELDGEYHLSSQQQAKDMDRTEILRSNGLRVIRFNNDEVETDINRVLQHIKICIKEIKANNL